MTSDINYTIRTGTVMSTPMTEGLGQTKINTLIWKVPEFIDLLKKKIYLREMRPEKPTDASEESIDSRFQLKMQFLGRDNDIIEIYFLSPNPVFLKSILTIRGWCDEHPVGLKECHTLQGNKWQYLATLYKRDIVDNWESRNYRNRYLRSDGSLELQFQFMITVDDRSNVPETQMSSDFENLLNNGILTDVTMKSAEGNEYKVHKAVLASRSVVLQAHFEHNTIECQTNIVKSPFEAEVLVEVLHFIYSDKAPRVDEIPERLLAAADHYQLSGLESLCAEALNKRLTVENAIETLQLAKSHSARVLKRLTLEFIKDGQAKLITRTEAWANVKSVELIKTIYEYIMADNIEAEVKT